MEALINSGVVIRIYGGQSFIITCNTQGSQTWIKVTPCAVSKPCGEHSIYLIGDFNVFL